MLLADGHGVFNPRNTGPVNLNLVGPNVTYHSTGLVMLDEGNLSFDGTGGGLSRMDLGNGIFLLNNGELYLNNLPTPTTLGQELVLLENIGSYPGSDTQFDNAPNGMVFGSDWKIEYRGTNIVLVAVSGCVQPSISITAPRQAGDFG